MKNVLSNLFYLIIFIGLSSYQLKSQNHSVDYQINVDIAGASGEDDLTINISGLPNETSSCSNDLLQAKAFENYPINISITRDEGSDATFGGNPLKYRVVLDLGLGNDSGGVVREVDLIWDPSVGPEDEFTDLYFFTPDGGYKSGGFSLRIFVLDGDTENEIGTLDFDGIPFWVEGIINEAVPIVETVKLPKLPELVLAAPPGDGSSVRYVMDASSCRTISNSVATSVGNNTSLGVQVGFEGQVGFILTAKVETTVSVSAGASIDYKRTSGSTYERCYQTKTETTLNNTGPSNLEDNQIFIGYGGTRYWGEFRGVALDDNCMPVIKKQGLTYYDSDFEEFTYRRSDITDEISQLALDFANTSLSDNQRTFAQNQIDVWSQVLAHNSDVITSVRLGTINPTSNVQILGGALEKGVTQAVTVTETESYDVDFVGGFNFSAEFNVEVAGNGVNGSNKFSFSEARSTGSTDGISTTDLINYKLADGTSGDVLNVDVFTHPQYGTPIFKLIDASSVTSCPYEGGRKRDQPYLYWGEAGGPTIQNIVVQDEDEDGQIFVDVQLCNNSSETRPYVLGLSNNDGAPASVKVGQFPLGNGPNVFIPDPISAGECIPLSISIEPNVQDPDGFYSGLEFKLFNECDPDDFKQITLTASFTVDFDGDGIADIDDLCPQAKDLALDFDGSDDWVFASAIPGSLDFIDGDFAFEAWVFPRSIGVQTIVSNNFNATYKLDNGKQSLGIEVDGDFEYHNGDRTLPLNEWSHVAVSFDWNSKTASFYLNGVLDGQRAYPAEDYDNDAMQGGFYIGVARGISSTGRGDYFDGILDDIVMWDKALSPADIQQSMSLPLTGTEVGLLSYIDFTEDGLIACQTGGAQGGIDKGALGGTYGLFDFSMEGCESNWTSGRNSDSDNDGEGDACDAGFFLADGDQDGIIDSEDLCDLVKDIALDFDGVDDYVEVPYDVSMNVVDGDFAFEAWVYPNGDRDHIILTKSQQFVGSNVSFSYSLFGGISGDDNKQALVLYNSGEEIRTSSTSVPLNTWSHVAVSFDWDSKTATFYLNGIPDGQATYPSNDNYSNGLDAPILIGRKGINFAYELFKGKLDNVAIWDKALSQSEVINCMSTQHSGSQSGLLSFYEFNDGDVCGQTGIVTAEDTGGDLDGTLMNFNQYACSSNWTIGRNSDFDGDGVGDACDDSSDRDMDGLLDGSDLCPDFRDTALDFDGVDDQVEVAHNSILNLVDGDFAFEAWVYPTEDKVNTIISKGAGATNTSFIYNLFGSSGGLGHTQGLYLTIDNSGMWHTSNTTVPLDQWSHVAVSFDWDTKVASFYLNGIPDGSASYDVNGDYYNADENSMYIGRQGWQCNCNFFKGTLDDVSVWDKTITQQEISEHISTRFMEQPVDLIALYDFNDGIACEEQMYETDNTENFVSNDIDGTLYNFSFSGCNSNWTSGRNLDSDQDGIGDSCDTDFCAEDYAGANGLKGTEGMMYGVTSYLSDGLIESTQTLSAGANVMYSTPSGIMLNPGFQVLEDGILECTTVGCDR